MLRAYHRSGASTYYLFEQPLLGGFFTLFDSFLKRMVGYELAAFIDGGRPNA